MEKNNSLVKRIRAIVSDSIWSIAALVLINCIAQFLVYPMWSRAFTDERYGNIIYVMSLVNTFAVSIGVSANYARMTESSKRETFNGDYNVILLVFSAIVGVMCFVLISLSDLGMSSGEGILAAVLAVLTMWRYYADVEYRLGLDYKGYFIYYLTISVGYVLGLLLFWATNLWPLALIPGEIFGLVLIFCKGKMFRQQSLVRSTEFRENCSTVLVLVVTNIMSNAIFNGDRILLQLLLSGSAVTLYYLASLVGKTMSLITTPLNSVIIGYLVKFKGQITRKMLHIFTLITLVGVALGTAVAVVGSHILIQILYPENYAQVKDFFVVANLTQVFYFVTNIVTTVLLRIAKTNRQLIVNVVYAVAFLALCVPAAIGFGISGFCVALLAANFVRYFVAICCCYLSVERRK